MAARILFAVNVVLALTAPVLSEPRGQGLAGRAAGVTARDVVCDLGSGDGRTAIIAAQEYGTRRRR